MPVAANTSNRYCRWRPSLLARSLNNVCYSIISDQFTSVGFQPSQLVSDTPVATICNHWLLAADGSVYYSDKNIDIKWKLGLISFKIWNILSIFNTLVLDMQWDSYLETKPESHPASIIMDKRRKGYKTNIN